MTIKFVINTGEATKKFKQNLAGLQDRMDRAITATTNMIASMILERVKSDIEQAGFSSRWTDNVEIDVQPGSLGNMRISLTGGDPALALFETGGVIHGDPLLWVPLSGTDAQKTRARDYPGGLFSAKYPRKYGPPLLFAISDKLPRYFGVESVTIPKLFHINDTVRSVMGNFRAIFDAEFRGGA